MGGMLEQDDAEDSGQKKSVFHSWEFWIMFIAIAIILFGNGRMGSFLMDRAIFGGTVIIISLTLLKGTQYYFKQISPQVTWEGGHNSHTGRIYPISGFGAIRLGGVTFPVNLEGKEGTLLFPITAVTGVGRNKTVMVRTVKYDINSLPVNLKVDLIQNKFPEPYLFGIASEIQMLNESKIPSVIGQPKIVTVGEIQELYKQTCEILSEYERLTKERGKPAEMIVADMSRLQSKAMRPSQMRGWSKKLGITEEKEE